MQQPMFSICIPNYNYAAYIGQTIQSVLEQSYQDFEIVVADNASTDDSVEVVRSFDDSRIRLIHNRYNIGFAPNLQRVTMDARGRFINLLSSDDLMMPNALETYAQILTELGDEADLTVLASAAFQIDGNGQHKMLLDRDSSSFRIVRRRLESEQELVSRSSFERFDGRDVLRDCLRRVDTGAVFCTTVYPRRLWEAVEGYNSVRLVGPDTHFFIKLMTLYPSFLFVNRPLYGYRVHDANQLSGHDREQTIIAPLDLYVNSVEFARLPLQELGLTREHLASVFVDRDCLTGAFVHLARGQYAYAARLWALALAAYPARALRNPKFYFVASLLALGPFSRLGAYPIWRMFGGKTVPFDLQER